jgi:hypothetical protein
MWTIPVSIVLASFPLASALGGKQCLSFDSDNNNFMIADHGSLVPIITNSSDAHSVHIAASTFADDLERVTGTRPGVWNDTVPDWASKVIMVGTSGGNGLRGKWEAYDIRVVSNPMDGVEEALMVSGSDKVGLIRKRLVWSTAHDSVVRYMGYTNYQNKWGYHLGTGGRMFLLSIKA